MAYWLTELESAIYARLIGDTGSGGLLASGSELVAAHPGGSGLGIYRTMIPEASTGTVYPCVTFMVGQASIDDAMRTATRACRVLFAVEVQRTGTSGATQFDPVARGAAIAQRVEGNWYEKAAGTAPDYGLDRWRPSLGGGTTWESDIMALESWATAHDESLFRWELNFTVLISRTGA